MALKHYDGPLLPQIPGSDEITPAEAAPEASVPAPPVPPPTMQGTPPSAVASSAPPLAEGPGWAMMVEYNGVEVTGVGDSFEEAVAMAREQGQAQWDAAQRQPETVFPLMWADGTPIEGLEREMLIEALEEYGAELQNNELLAMVRKFKRALGAEE